MAWSSELSEPYDAAMKIAVLGAGAGGTALAFDHADHGDDVRLFDFPEYPDNIAAVDEAGGIHAEGDVAGFAPIRSAGHDIDDALGDAELVYVVGPAYSTERFGESVAGRLRRGQHVVVSPGSCGGALVFARAAGLDIGAGIAVAETSTLPYAVRLVAPGRVRVFLKLKGGVLLAGLPSETTAAILELMAGVYPTMEAASGVMQTTLQNANPVIHPAVTLANAARIEGTGGDFLFYEDGVTDATGRLIEAVDRERIAIGDALGLEVVPDPEMGVRQGYMVAADYGAGYRTAPGFRGIGAQPRLEHRYLDEDVGYGLVFLSALGAQVEVPTPTIDAIVHLASLLRRRDFRGEAARTPASLGIDGLSAAELARL